MGRRTMIRHSGIGGLCWPAGRTAPILPRDGRGPRSRAPAAPSRYPSIVVPATSRLHQSFAVPLESSFDIFRRITRSPQELGDIAIKAIFYNTVDLS